MAFQSAKRICAVSKKDKSGETQLQLSFNPPSGFVLFRRLAQVIDGTIHRLVSIRQADLCCFEGRTMSRASSTVASFQSAKRICAVSKASVPASDPRARRCFNPPSGFVLFRRSRLVAAWRVTAGFNPPSGFVLFRSRVATVSRSEPQEVSIRQADLCCFEERDLAFTTSHLRFQSAKRICAVSKSDATSSPDRSPHVSIRQADLCCFEGAGLLIGWSAHR